MQLHYRSRRLLPRQRRLQQLRQNPRAGGRSLQGPGRVGEQVHHERQPHGLLQQRQVHTGVRGHDLERGAPAAYVNNAQRKQRRAIAMRHGAILRAECFRVHEWSGTRSLHRLETAKYSGN